MSVRCVYITMDSTRFKTELYESRRVFDNLLKSWDRMSEDQQIECEEELKFISHELGQIQDNLVPRIDSSISNLAMVLIALILLLFVIVYMKSEPEL